MCVCLLACLLGATTYRKSLLVLTLYIVHHAFIQKQLEIEDLNRGWSSSSMVTARIESTHGLTCSVARVIEVTARHCADAVCLCCLTHGSYVEVTGLHKRRWLECCCLSMPSPPALCAGPICVQHALYIVAMPDSLFMYTCVHSDDIQSYAFNCSMFCTCTRSIRLAPQCHAFI